MPYWMRFPLFALVTPNALEATALTGKTIATDSDLLEAGYALLDLGAHGSNEGRPP